MSTEHSKDLVDLRADARAMRADIDRIRATLDDLRDLGPVVGRLAQAMDDANGTNGEAALTMARLSALIEGLTQEQAKLRGEIADMWTELQDARIASAGLLERQIPLAAAVVAAVAAVAAVIWR